MKTAPTNNKLSWIYTLGFFIILALPILDFPPLFFPPDWGKTIIFRLIMTALMMLFFWQWFFGHQKFTINPLIKNPIAWALAGIFITFLLSSIFSVDPYFSFLGNPVRSGGIITFFFYIAFSLLSFFVIKEHHFKTLLRWAILAGILVSVIALIQYYGILTHTFKAVDNRPASTIGNPILLGIYLLLLCISAFTLFIEDKRILYKFYYGASALLFLVVILISGSRAAYLGLASGIIYFLLFYPVRNLARRLDPLETKTSNELNTLEESVGRAVSNGVNPKKILSLKISFAALLIVMCGIILYANQPVQSTYYPNWVKDNKIFQSVQPRLSIDSFLNDGRFPAWRVGGKAFLQRPLFGWGPENYAAGFDRNYTPEAGAQWWDRAHNVPLEVAATSGIFALISYLGLFIALFWQLNKFKKNHTSATVLAHGIQTVFIAYFVANLFSFDSYASYILFFFLTGYTLYLTTHFADTNFSLVLPYPKIAFSLLLILAIWFSWQYHLLPFGINAKVNQASQFSQSKNCTKAFELIDAATKQRSFLDSYVRLKYAQIVKTCSEFYPENELGYLTKGVQAVAEATHIQPNYTRYWIFLGTSLTTLANKEVDVNVKKNLLEKADAYFTQALLLAPGHQELWIERVKKDIVAEDFSQAQSDAKECIALGQQNASCWWYLALAQTYQKDPQAQTNFQIAKEKGYNLEYKESLKELANAYGFLKDWLQLIAIYKKLIAMDYNIPQYHSSLAFFYREIGDYKNARHEAMETLRLSPESKANVEAFLKSLP